MGYGSLHETEGVRVKENENEQKRDGGGRQIRNGTGQLIRHTASADNCEGNGEKNEQTTNDGNVDTAIALLRETHFLGFIDYSLLEVGWVFRETFLTVPVWYDRIMY